MELEVELEGLEVYLKYSISWSTYVQAFTHFLNFFMGAKGPTILHLFFFLFSYCRPPSMWGWCVSNRTALSVSVGPTWCLHLPRTVSNILPWLVMAHPHPVLLTYVEICLYETIYLSESLSHWLHLFAVALNAHSHGLAEVRVGMLIYSKWLVQSNIDTYTSSVAWLGGGICRSTPWRFCKC